MELRVWKARHGDREALESLLREVHPLLYGLARRILEDAAAARAVTEEGLARVLRSLHRFRDQGRFKAWALSLAIPALRERCREAGRPMMSTEAFEERLGVEEGGGSPLQREVPSGRILSGFARLPAEDQMILYLSSRPDLGPEDVALALGISEHALPIRFDRALRLLRLCVSGEASS